jgi:hypothetical protein
MKCPHFSKRSGPNGGKSDDPQLGSSDSEQDPWSVAYQQLKQENNKLVEKFEMILRERLHLDDQDIVPEQSPSISPEKSDESQQKLEQSISINTGNMERIARMALDKAKKFECVENASAKAVEFLGRVQDIVAKSLVAYPPASIAWTGICILLPVCIVLLHGRY